MSGGFVKNRNGKFLTEIIKSILPKAETASFLVGYFYSSGFYHIYPKSGSFFYKNEG
jgi:hypothetical protein